MKDSISLFFYFLSMKDTFYFSHDYNSRNDEKIKKMIRKHWILSYGIFWSIIEDLYNNANALHLDSEWIAYDLRVDSDIIESIIHDFDLFVIDWDKFSSKSVQSRLDERDIKSAKARESAQARWGKTNANALQTKSESNAKKERKGKEKKEKEINIYRAFKHLTLYQEDFEKLNKIYSKEKIDFILDKIENYKKNSNYTSLYLTANNWLKDEVWKKEEWKKSFEKESSPNWSEWL